MLLSRLLTRSLPGLRPGLLPGLLAKLLPRLLSRLLTRPLWRRLPSLLVALLAVLMPTGNAHADLASVADTVAVGEAIGQAPVIAVASSLRAVWPALTAAWQTELPGLKTRPTFGASHTLARQMRRGAPFEMLLSADDGAIDALQDAGLTSSSPKSYAVGRLALVQRGDGATPNTDAIERLRALLTEADDSRFALADPAHAPYGVAAREVLMKAELWPLAPTRLVVGENAAQTLQFVYTGAVDAALVPLSLVVRDVPEDVSIARIDVSWHEPLNHRLAVSRTASQATRALAAWLVGAPARQVFEDAGFDRAP